MSRSRPSFDISLNLFTAVFERAGDIAVNLLNKDYTVLWANELMATQIQRSLDEVIGKPCYMAFRRRETPCTVCMLKIVSETKQPCIMERWLDLPNRERRYAEVRAYPVFDEKGFVKHVFEILRPLGQQKKEEERNRRYIETLEEALRRLNAPEVAARDRIIADGQGVHLTLREQEVIRLIAQGFSNRDIAGILNISPDTVKTHVRNIFSKLNVKDRTRAAVWAASNKLT
jgi:DNA-binding CsgD family transcriptional regulator